MSNRKQTPVMRCALALTLGSSLALSGTAIAQVQKTQALEEIIVTARKRQESLMDVPVAITAMSGKMMTDRAINDMDALARQVPGLIIGEGSGTVQGGNIVMRGISGADANPVGDQAVSFNIDGVQVARASVRRMAEMDMAQVEVLKGPQALFYGKNSPGGIISIHTADPTEEFSSRVSTGYETEGKEWRTDGYISGPITDTLGYRLAAFNSNMDGWVDSIVPSDSLLQPRDREGPDQDEWAVRGTLKWEPNEDFDAKLKLTYNEREGAGSTANTQFIYCQNAPFTQGGVADGCTADDHVSVADQGPGFPWGPETKLEQEQILGALDMNYRLNEQLTLTSLTGYYDVDLDNIGQYTDSYIPSQILPSRNLMKLEETSQEFRLTSDYDGPFNFMVGAMYQDSTSESGSNTFLGSLGAIVPGKIFELNHYYMVQDGEAYSVFAQMMFEITDHLEISIGGRNSHEKKEIVSAQNTPSAGPLNPGEASVLNNVDVGVDKLEFDNFSPEITLTYRPTDQLTAYTSYKEGFLSGGFNGSSGFASGANYTYGQQLVDGWEGGLKGEFFDGSLQAGLDIYNYTVEGLQVVITVNNTNQELRNAGKVRSRGGEFNFNWLTPLDGLSVYGAIAYFNGGYMDYQSSCHRGTNEFTDPPCVMQVSRVTGELALLSDISGTDLVRAPEYSGNLGFNYETPIGAGLNIGLFADMTFSDDYLTDVTSQELFRSPSYEIYNAGLRLYDDAERWEVALIGKNLSEEFYWTRTSDTPFTGSPPGVVPGVPGNGTASVSRGREIWLRLSYRFGQ